MDEKFEKGELPVRGCGKDVARGWADNGCAGREEVVCNVNVSSAKGLSKALMEKEGCAGWGPRGNDGVDGEKGSLLACGFEGGNVGVLAVNDLVVTGVDGDVVVG